MKVTLDLTRPSSWIKRHKIISGLIGTFLFLFILGSIVGTSETKVVHETKVKVVYKTRVIHDTKTVTKGVMPKECDAVFETVERIMDADATIYNVSDKQIDIISETRMAIASQDNASMVKQAERQIAIDAETNGAADSLANLRPAVHKAVSACRSAAGRH